MSMKQSCFTNISLHKVCVIGDTSNSKADRFPYYALYQKSTFELIKKSPKNFLHRFLSCKQLFLEIFYNRSKKEKYRTLLSDKIFHPFI